MSKASGQPALVPATLELNSDGIPYSAAFDDIYHSKSGGLAQACDVFMAGNGLPERWRGRRSFAICETGFGLGLNFLATWQRWRQDAGHSERLHFVSCELHPFSAVDLAALHRHLFANDAELMALSAELIGQWPLLIAGFHRLELAGGRVVLTLLFGDALSTIGKLAGKFDAFYLDGFAPAKNPDIWTVRLFKQFARLSAREATLATYTAVGDVRRGLMQAGFAVERRAGFGSKRHMLAGVFRGERPPLDEYGERHVVIIGAGMAGAAMAERMSSRGWRVTLLERESEPAQGASGNKAGAYRPVVSADDNLQARLARAAFLYGARRLAHLPNLVWAACGALLLARDAEEAARFEQIAATGGFPPAYLRHVSQAEAGEIAGAPVAAAGLWFSDGAWIKPTSFVAALLAQLNARDEIRYRTTVEHLEHDGERWRLFDAAGTELASAPIVILANAADASRLAPELYIEADQRLVTHLPADASMAPKTVVCCGGYLTPAHDGVACLGSTKASDASPAMHQANVDLLADMFTAPPALDATTLQGRLCQRPITIDRLPHVGPLADALRFEVKHAGSLHLAPRRPGLYALTGFGARGLLWCSLLAELLACQINGEPLPVERDLVLAVDPARFLARRIQRPDAAED